MRARTFADENRKWWTLGALPFALFLLVSAAFAALGGLVAVATVRSHRHLDTAEVAEATAS